MDPAVTGSGLEYIDGYQHHRHIAPVHPVVRDAMSGRDHGTGCMGNLYAIAHFDQVSLQHVFERWSVHVRARRGMPARPRGGRPGRDRLLRTGGDGLRGVRSGACWTTGSARLRIHGKHC